MTMNCILLAQNAAFDLCIASISPRSLYCPRLSENISSTRVLRQEDAMETAFDLLNSNFLGRTCILCRLQAHSVCLPMHYSGPCETLSVGLFGLTQMSSIPASCAPSRLYALTPFSLQIKNTLSGEHLRARPSHGGSHTYYPVWVDSSEHVASPSIISPEVFHRILR